MQVPIRWSPHISGSELVAPGRESLLTDERARSLTLLAADLELIRELVGNKPIRITSGLRPGSGSQHNHGQAVDIQIDGMTPRALIALIWQHRERMPHRLRQVIAETLSADPDDLDQPMGKGSGRWVHVAILGLPGASYSTASGKPWSTHCASDGQSYPAWSPPGAAA